MYWLSFSSFHHFSNSSSTIFITISWKISLFRTSLTRILMLFFQINRKIITSIKLSYFMPIKNDLTSLFSTIFRILLQPYLSRFLVRFLFSWLLLHAFWCYFSESIKTLLRSNCHTYSMPIKNDLTSQISRQWIVHSGSSVDVLDFRSDSSDVSFHCSIYHFLLPNHEFRFLTPFLAW